jgi:transposase-like protein
MSTSKVRARELAGVIMQVRSGQISATEGARMLGISRKTYYQWENRALEGMMAQLEPLESGRPQTPVNPEVEAMKKKIAELEKKLEVAEQTAEVRAILRGMEEVARKRDIKKKNQK